MFRASADLRTRSRFRYLVSLLPIFLLFAAGCADRTSETEGVKGNDDGHLLIGTKWILSKIHGDSLSPESIVILHLEKGGIASGFSGCNSYSGGYEFVGEKVIFSELQSTDTVCSPQIAKTEEEYLNTLAASDAYAERGIQLELLDGAGEIAMIFEPFVHTDLRGSSWLAEEFSDGAGSTVSLLPDTEISANFDDDGLLSGSASCNGYSASYDVTNGLINIEALVMTEMYCMEPESIMDQETQYLAALANAAAYFNVSDRLVLLDDADALLVSFTSTLE